MTSGRENLIDLYSCLHSKDGWHYKTKVKLNAPAIRLLRHYWSHPPESDIGRPWGPQYKIRLLQIVLSTDASGVAWSAHVHGKWETGRHQGLLQAPEINNLSNRREIQLDPTRSTTQGQFSIEEQQEWIHILEYKAGLNAITNFKYILQDTCITLWCDCTTLVTGLSKNYSKNENICAYIKEIT